MLFSSPVFLYLFLPLTLLGYYLARKNYKNYWLLFVSLIFFAWGGVSYTVILLASIILNYLFGIRIHKNINSKRAYHWLVFSVAVNLLILVIFKYANFIIFNLNKVIDIATIPNLPQTEIILPIGISFYTFHSLSYLTDIYRGKTPAQRNILDLSLYICMFSQLIAGPIIRYADVWEQLRGRVHSMSKFVSGIERFVIGLGKKVLLANTFARVADNIFSTDVIDLDAPLAWLGAVCYALQIYCDFSGYSDMAIGLGRMFGFEFMENFNFPYMARSVREFWKRWHISLSTFFRDYVYIPLGGDRLGTGRTYLNLSIVFFLTGFWHGASWNFIVWGMFHGSFLVLERSRIGALLNRAPGPVSNLYTLLVVIFAWVLFRAETLGSAIQYWKAMFNFEFNIEQKSSLMHLLDIELYIALVICIPGVFGLYDVIGRKAGKFLEARNSGRSVTPYFLHIGSAFFYSILLVICSMYLVAGTYNPFIYYKF